MHATQEEDCQHTALLKVTAKATAKNRDVCASDKDTVTVVDVVNKASMQHVTTDAIKWVRTIHISTTATGFVEYVVLNWLTAL